jgi:hypothetical protein
MKEVVQFQIGRGMINCQTYEPVPVQIFLHQMRQALEQYRSAKVQLAHPAGFVEPECDT